MLRDIDRCPLFFSPSRRPKRRRHRERERGWRKKRETFPFDLMRKYIYICVCVEREYRRSAPMVWRRMLLLLETSGIEPITQTHTHPDILLEALKLIIFQYHCVRFLFSFFSNRIYRNWICRTFPIWVPICSAGSSPNCHTSNASTFRWRPSPTKFAMIFIC